jgi:NADH-quinone oxidoreductase subunit M
MDLSLWGALLAPLLGVAFIILFPLQRQKWIETAGLVAALTGTICAISLFFFPARFDATWIPAIGARLSFATDAYSVALVSLAGLLTTLALTLECFSQRTREFVAYFLFLQFAVTGAFLAQDFLLFFFFFEVALLPMYFVINIWGGPRRNYAATKFILYTMLGSVLMLVAGLVLADSHFRQRLFLSFAFEDLRQVSLSPEKQWLVFGGFLLGFGVKIPIFPLHTWLPDAHVEAPTGASIILAGVLLKLGTYGLTRIALPLVSEPFRSPEVTVWLGAIALVTIIYGALLSLAQSDWKKLIAYSSVSHMGFAILGLFAQNPEGVTGSMLQQINHGISTPLMFALAGMAAKRTGSRNIADYGGLIRSNPAFSILFLIAILSSAGAPPLNGFVGEFPIIAGVWKQSAVWALTACIGIALGFAYLFWLYQRIVFGPANQPFASLSTREWLVVSPLVFLIFVIGLFPAPLVERLMAVANQLLVR